MAKQNINVGTTANDKKGDSLRAAFVKVNANFTELYAALGLTDVTLNLGAFTFTGSTMSTDDSTNIVIDKPITVNGEITVDGDIVPKTNLGASLGTPTKQFKSLYVSNNTIFIGGFPISVDGSGNLVVNNGVGGGEFSNLTVANTFEVEGTLEITKNNREGTVALSVTSSFDTGRLGAGQLVFEGNHPTYGIIPSNDDRYSLGNPAFGWSTVYTHAIDFANGTQQNSAGVEIYDANTSSPYVVFPVITGGDQLQIVGAEVSTIAGNLALTSVADANIISNGSGAIPGGSKTWTFGTDGSLTLPGDIRSEGAINIDINLSDSTLRRWQFGEDGNLEAPGIVSAAGLRTSETKIALGSNAGQTSQGSSSVAVGAFAGQTSQGPLSVAIGYGAGATTQGTSSVAVGNLAGSTTQGGLSVAVGSGAGQINQGYEAVAVGFTTGLQDQGIWSVAIGSYAGAFSQGEDAIAIGRFAGQTNQPDNTIILNASGSAVDGVAAQTNSFYVAPIRNIGGTSGVLQYNAATKEVSYSSDITSEGNINIEINLSDSTLRRWQFGEDGELTLPEDAVVKTTSGHLTIKGQNYVYIDSATNGQIEIGRNSGVGAVVLGSKSRGTNVIVDDLFVANGVYEFFSSLADATGVVTHNCANGHLFYHTSPDANWTVNLTNLLDTWNRATSVTLIIAQGATGYYPSAVQIAGVAQTIKWQGNATPTPSTNRTDVVTFSIINNAGTYTVLGQLTGF